jgi:D-alanyl-D-alanine carboxypeptidase/D-alanyl-D-alanine-endopeptidase (penicillin-binding protein 4)
LARAISSAGPYSGAYVADATTGRRLFASRPDTPRILASNTKLFTTSAVLGRYGADSTIATTVLGNGSLAANGTWTGDLYLRGGGDPSFGSTAFAKREYAARASVEDLAAQLELAGIKRVSGAVAGDESLFDSLRGGPDSGYGVSVWVGPLSALSYDRGLANSSGSAFQSRPPAFAAAKLDAALERAGVPVSKAPKTGAAPGSAVSLAEARSPTVARLIQITNKRSDNFFAELLVKGLTVVNTAGGSLRGTGDAVPATGATTAQASGVGTTRGGARAAAAFARELGATPASLVDGSGLSRADRASPRRVATLLTKMRARPDFDSFYGSLSIAGRDGTLYDRMRRGAAHGRCRAKTGTLSNVSALSGYCTSRSGRTIVFSILMNYVSTTGARKLQDRMAQAMAGFRG